ncbi:predicted protein [Sclerotinia sclerotiorum 1980 UF-70]|uniref:Uncharacterized protein n=1 Tax=Sclerotinia sclerotiorum (strain ATCC 18683 / 1980 / Ss-1) TaxID=665079 RepID=A7EKM2_SCLS1|nr:predicted protein [Sclerotinia sclerotiorum 1980 UF-70]EDO03388.1 predicted protein [Sclerotinia sclerotiorum 1980 UF-70]
MNSGFVEDFQDIHWASNQPWILLETINRNSRIYKFSRIKKEADHE